MNTTQELLFLPSFLRVAFILRPTVMILSIIDALKLLDLSSQSFKVKLMSYLSGKVTRRAS